MANWWIKQAGNIHSKAHKIANHVGVEVGWDKLAEANREATSITERIKGSPARLRKEIAVNTKKEIIISTARWLNAICSTRNNLEEQAIRENDEKSLDDIRAGMTRIQEKCEEDTR